MASMSNSPRSWPPGSSMTSEAARLAAIEEMNAHAEVRVADVFRRAAVSRPNHIALRRGDDQLTYAQLQERSSRLAQALLANGWGAGTRIAYLGRAAPEVIELLAAVSKIGAVIVPLNWRLSGRELAGVLTDALAPLLIVDTAYVDAARELLDGLTIEVELRVIGSTGPDGY